MYLQEFWELWVSLGLPYTATQHDELEWGVSHPQIIKIWPIPFSMGHVMKLHNFLTYPLMTVFLIMLAEG